MKAIVYTSNTGFTARYAEILGRQTGLEVWELSEAVKKLPKGPKSSIWAGCLHPM